MLLTFLSGRRELACLTDTPTVETETAFWLVGKQEVLIGLGTGSVATDDISSIQSIAAVGLWGKKKKKKKSPLTGVSLTGCRVSTCPRSFMSDVCLLLVLCAWKRKKKTWFEDWSCWKCNNVESLAWLALSCMDSIWHFYVWIYMRCLVLLCLCNFATCSRRRALEHFERESHYWSVTWYLLLRS